MALFNIHVDVHVHGSKERDSELFGLLQQILRQGEEIMARGSEYAKKVDEFMDRQDKALESIASDIKGIKDDLTAINTSGDVWTAEDQTAMDHAMARIQGATEKMEALDAETPPKPTPEVPSPSAANPNPGPGEVPLSGLPGPNAPAEPILSGPNPGEGGTGITGNTEADAARGQRGTRVPH